MCNLSKGVEEKGIRKGIIAMVSTWFATDAVNSEVSMKFPE
jgi:hypothetical protein